MANPRLRGGTGIVMKADNLKRLGEDIEALTKLEVLVGFPEDTAARTEDDEPTPITNAAIAYVQDNGEPDRNISARPFMIPGMNDARDKVERIFKKGAKSVLTNGQDGSTQQFKYGLITTTLMQVGLAVQASIRGKINEGIPPPLSEATLRQRAARGRQGAMWELAWRQAGAPASLELAKPLVDTGQLRNAVNFVIRERKDRKG